MTVSKQVTRKNGTVTNVSASTQEELDDAVKTIENETAPVYPNINHPVQKGHDLVALDGELNKVLINGEGAHNSPYDAIDEDGNESGDPKIQAAGIEEAAYKQVAGADNNEQGFVEATEAEVKAAQKDSEPAADVQPEGPKKAKGARG